MSNRATIEPTEFKNVRGGDVTFGVRVYDDYASAYLNLWESIPDDDLDVLRQVLESDDENIKALLNFIQEEETGVYIGDVYYDFEQIKECFD